MKKIALLMVILMTTLLITQSANADDRHRIRLEGVIAEIGDHGIVLHTRHGNIRIAVTADTHIERNGERVRFSALHVRDHAIVLAKIIHRDRHHHRLVALGIRARGDGR